MGTVRVPAAAYYGAQTQRASENFRISGLRFQRDFIRALGIVKLASAKANMKLKLLDQRRGVAIVKAAEEVVRGDLESQFILDIFQTGSGTSTNMNVNEVIANRAAELLGGKRGDRHLVHPNDHVNMCQSTNDVFPTAIHIAALEGIRGKLIPALDRLALALEEKAKEFKDVIKAARTHMQDAVPISLGQEFDAYATMVRNGIDRLVRASGPLEELALGGTAVGTGLEAHPRFAEETIKEINRLTKQRFRRAKDAIEALQSRDGCVEASGAIRVLAISIYKISNDLILLSSGPRTGLGEIHLPPIQPGSSIMPGKVNPVIPEAVRMAMVKLVANDLAIEIAGASGQLDLNTMMPLIAYDLLQSIDILTGAANALSSKCVNGIIADEKKCLEYAEKSLALVTAVAHRIGYDRAAELYKRAEVEGKSIREVLIEANMLPKEEVDHLLDLRSLTKGGRV